MPVSRVKHVVMWRLSADESDKAAVVAEMRGKLTALVGVVPGLTSVDVVSDLGDAPANFDVMLLSEHDSVEALAVYQAHPAHLEVAAWVKTQVTERAAVDYLVA